MEEDEASECEHMHVRKGGEEKERREKQIRNKERRNKRDGEKQLEARVDQCSHTWVWVLMPCGDTGLWSQMHWKSDLHPTPAGDSVSSNAVARVDG